MLTILQFLALQDAIFDHASYDDEVCETIARMHSEAGVAEVAPCHYFTSLNAVEKHLAYGLPIDADVMDCRSFLQGMDAKMTLKATHLVEQCRAETYPLTYSDDKKQPSCAALTTIANKTLAGWSFRLVGLDKYNILGGGPSAVATVCYPFVLETIVDVGKKIDKQLKKEFATVKKEVDVFVKWYLSM
jgi:hypothetical protein